MQNGTLVQLGDKLVDFSKANFADLQPLTFTEREVQINFVRGSFVRVRGDDWKVVVEGQYLPMNITAPKRV